MYTALADGDRGAVASLLHPDFEASFTEGLPAPIGGVHHGAAASIDDGWWAIGSAFAVRAEPSDWIDCAGDRLLVLGRYFGRSRDTGTIFEAAFGHLWTARGDRLSAITQLTDSARWCAAYRAA
jgi:ketosteroid isomerase-like protein